MKIVIKLNLFDYKQFQTITALILSAFSFCVHTIAEKKNKKIKEI